MTKPTTYTIRKATEADAESLIQFNMAMALETENKILDMNKIEPGVRGLLANPQYGFYMVAEHKGTAVGSLMVTTEWSDWRNGIFWWIQSVYVIPKYRRKGVYRSMYQKINEMAKSGQSQNICGFRLYVEKENKIAQKTYRDLGMSETRYKMFEDISKE
jgi:ribosomal protein S18 acetylase RimI-like enzyme